MELGGFILLFIGIAYAVIPDLNIRIYHKNNPVTQGKISRKEYIKSMRTIGIAAIFIGGVFLLISYFV